jgi:hypothetical protein
MPHKIRNTDIFQVALHIALSSFIDHTLIKTSHLHDCDAEKIAL